MLRFGEDMEGFVILVAFAGCWVVVRKLSCLKYPEFLGRIVRLVAFAGKKVGVGWW